ncbi:hypothetical protein N7447_011381 [Penicillium robsamsonii]|uniref:uncharacterized protein n=1 Tax=Penicillium robsamsonii TaxID=1792511 RepID=UPI00254776D4|nr:uncharacterized protein N7447_011381 [Penicillium robsamsonii]KAJ5807148.1 hypothetical protein N7447_011381 [Penicillium robsamsonii]
MGSVGLVETRITRLRIFPARLISSPVLMVAASRRTSALGEITHRSGASGHPATPDPPYTILPA